MSDVYTENVLYHFCHFFVSLILFKNKNKCKKVCMLYTLNVNSSYFYADEISITLRKFIL